MQKRDLGLVLNRAPGMDAETQIRMMAELGFTVTFDMGYKSREYLVEMSRLCGSYGIRFENLHGPWAGINSIWLPGEEGEEMLSRLKDCVDNCVMVGAPVAVVHLSSGENPPEVTQIGKDRFAELVAYANQRGVKPAFENQRKLFNLSWALETFGPEQAGFCWDCGHEGCFTPGQEFMPLFGDRLICTHIHDNMGRYNEDLHLLPFDGGLDFARVACQLREASWQGSLMLEVSVYRDLAPEEYFRRAAAAVHRLAEMI